MAEITLATLSAQVESLAKNMSEDMTEIKENLKTMNGRQRDDHDRVMQLEERVNVRSGLLAALTVLASAIAAYLGIKN